MSFQGNFNLGIGGTAGGGANAGINLGGNLNFGAGAQANVSNGVNHGNVHYENVAENEDNLRVEAKMNVNNGIHQETAGMGVGTDYKANQEEIDIGKIEIDIRLKTGEATQQPIQEEESSKLKQPGSPKTLLTTAQGTEAVEKQRSIFFKEWEAIK